MYPKKPKTLIQTDTFIPMSTTALFTIGKIWKQPKCLPIDEWIKKKWSTCTMEYDSAIKNKILPSATTRIDLEGIISQSNVK